MVGARDGLDLLLADLDSKPNDTPIVARIYTVVNEQFRDYREFLFTKARLLERNESRTATVTGLKLNVRTGPGTTYTAVAQLAQGAVVEVVDADVVGWLKIVEGVYTGRFISATYVSF